MGGGPGSEPELIYGRSVNRCSDKRWKIVGVLILKMIEKANEGEGKPSRVVREHRETAKAELKVALLTVSDSRFEEIHSGFGSQSVTDESAKEIKDGLESRGHDVVFYSVLPDDEGMIQAMISYLISQWEQDVIVTNGGTGIAPNDVTVEAVREVLDKELEGFGELFRRRSYESLGKYKTSSMMSRAVAGSKGKVAIFTLPGSPDAVRTGLELILEEAEHIVKMIQRKG